MARHKESDTASRGCVTRRGRGGSLQRLSTARSQRHSSRAAWAATVIDARHASRVRTRAAAAGNIREVEAQLWGSIARAFHRTGRPSASDPLVNFLSYWTDNGAYYYGDQWGEA